MPLELRGKVKPGQPDRRYYMIRVQEAGRRVVISSGTRDKNLALKKEQAIVEALRADHTTSKANLVALVRGTGHVRHKAAVRLDAPLTLAEAIRLCFADREIWGLIKSKSSYKSNLKRLTDYFGENTPVAGISSKGLKDFTNALFEDGLTTGAVNRILGVIARLLKASVGFDNGPTVVPKVKLPGGAKARTFVLSYEDEARIFEAARKVAQSKRGQAQTFLRCWSNQVCALAKPYSSGGPTSCFRPGVTMLVRFAYGAPIPLRPRRASERFP